MILFVRQTSLIAQHLDLKRGELTGNPVTVADAVGVNGTGYGGFSVSSDGRLAYRSESAGLHQLKWYDRTGKALGVAGEPDSAQLLYPELSPDGGHVVFQRTVQGNLDVWLMDLVRGDMGRFTLDCDSPKYALERSSGHALVPMVQSAHFRNLNDSASLQILLRSGFRRIFI